MASKHVLQHGTFTAQLYSAQAVDDDYGKPFYSVEDAAKPKTPMADFAIWCDTYAPELYLGEVDRASDRLFLDAEAMYRRKLTIQIALEGICSAAERFWESRGSYPIGDGAKTRGGAAMEPTFEQLYR